jgi:hypothetical protein
LTAASATGVRCWPGSRRIGWSSPGRSTATGSTTPTHASEIEVRFTTDGPDQTSVQLEHRLLERPVDGQALRDGIVGGGGWPSLLDLFAKAAANQR